MILSNYTKSMRGEAREKVFKEPFFNQMIKII